jgi:hypothetical protein
MLLLGLLAFVGFFVYHRTVEYAATKHAKTVCPDIVLDYLKSNPSLLRDAVRDNIGLVASALRGPGDGGDLADDIARAMEGGNEAAS